jgi:hypothetical protein
LKSNFSAYRLIWSGFALYALRKTSSYFDLEAIYLKTAQRNRKTLSEDDASAIPLI